MNTLIVNEQHIRSLSTNALEAQMAESIIENIKSSSDKTETVKSILFDTIEEAYNRLKTA